MKKSPVQLLLFAIIAVQSVSAQFATVPVKLLDNGHLLLKVQVNDAKEKVNFLFDTGATSGVIDKSLAKRMGLKVVSQQRVPGAGGVQIYDILSAQDVNLSDDLFLAYDHMVSVDMTRFHEVIDERYDGILGFNLLREFVTKIDYEKEELVLYENMNDVNVDDYSVIPFTFHNGISIPQFDVSFTLTNGEKFTGRILFDSGAGFTLSVNSPFAKKKDILKKADKSILLKSESLGTTSTSREIAIQSFQMGDFTFNDLPIKVSNDKAGVSSYQGYLGIMGAEIIQRFHVILNYRSKKLYLKPNKFYATSFKFPLSGLRLKKKNNQIIIDMVTDKSPAYEAGLRKGDVILSVDGTTYNRISEYEKALRQEGKSVNVQVTTASNETKTYTFKLQKLI
jgi:hypothetical protein